MSPFGQQNRHADIRHKELRAYYEVDSKRKSDEMIRDSVTKQQEAAVQSLLDTRKKPMVSGFHNSPQSFSSSHVASAAGGAARSLEGQRSVSSMHGHSEEQRCHGGNGNCGLLSL